MVCPDDAGRSLQALDERVTFSTRKLGVVALQRIGHDLEGTPCVCGQATALVDGEREPDTRRSPRDGPGLLERGLCKVPNGHAGHATAPLSVCHVLGRGLEPLGERKPFIGGQEPAAGLGEAKDDGAGRERSESLTCR